MEHSRKKTNRLAVHQPAGIWTEIDVYKRQVRDLSRLSQERFVLLKILQFLQDHNAVLITTGSDLRYELYIEGLEEPLIRRAARKNCNVPW